MMARTSSTITQSFAENRTTLVVARRQNVMFLVFITLSPYDSVGNVVNYFNKT